MYKTFVFFIAWIVFALPVFKLVMDKDLFREIHFNGKINDCALVRKSNFDPTVLSKKQKRAFPLIPRDTIYERISWSENKMSKEAFSLFTKEYSRQWKVLQKDKFCKGYNGSWLDDKDPKDSLYYDETYVKIVNDKLTPLLQVHIVFEGKAPFDPSKEVKVLYCNIRTGKGIKPFTILEKKSILKQMSEFPEAPDEPPPGN